MSTDLSIHGNSYVAHGSRRTLLDEICQCDRPSGARCQSVDLMVRNLGRGGRM